MRMPLLLQGTLFLLLLRITRIVLKPHNWQWQAAPHASPAG
jgi:hypothetical protein